MILNGDLKERDMEMVVREAGPAYSQIEPDYSFP